MANSDKTDRTIRLEPNIHYNLLELQRKLFAGEQKEGEKCTD